MQEAWDKVMEYWKSNAANIRKGYKLGEISNDQLLVHTLEEMMELVRAPDHPDEMADVLSCLFHYCHRKGWTMSQIQHLIIFKLELRFGPLPQSQVSPQTQHSPQTQTQHSPQPQHSPQTSTSPQTSQPPQLSQPSQHSQPSQPSQPPQHSTDFT